MNWTVSGRLRVDIEEDDLLPSTFAVKADLAGIEVEVMGSTRKSGGFSSWGKTATNSQGKFTVLENLNSKPRRIKVRIRFRDRKLKVTAPAPASDWYVIYESDGKVNGPLIKTAIWTGPATGGSKASTTTGAP